jgi:hypothetical protein
MAEKVFYEEYTADAGTCSVHGDVRNEYKILIANFWMEEKTLGEVWL